jgi:ribosomal protein S16
VVVADMPLATTSSSHTLGKPHREPTNVQDHASLNRQILTTANSTARDSKPLEVLGTYNPIPQTPVGAAPGDRQQKDIKLDVSRAKYWLGVGAQPSDTVWRLLAMVREDNSQRVCLHRKG